MGAYSNPDQNAGVDALKQEGQAYQSMFESLSKSFGSASEKIAERQRANEKRNQTIIDGSQEGGAKLQLLIQKGIAKAKTGMNYDCYQDGVKEWIEINNKVGFGTASPAEKRRAAEIVASIENFSNTASDAYGLIEKYDKSEKLVGEGAPDLAGCDPDILRAIIGLKNTDGDVIQPSLYKDKDGMIDYTNQGYTLFAYKDKDGTEHPEVFISGQQLKKALDSGGASGMVYKKSYAGDNKKIKDAFKIGDNGIGIFEYDKNEPTGKVSTEYLTDEPGKEIPIRSVQGGTWYQKTMKVDMPGILKAVGTQLDAVADASATVTNEIATKYNNYVLPILDKNRNPNFESYNALDDYAKFVPIPGYDNAFPYNEAILTSDEEKLNAIRHNNRAAFAQTLKDEQLVGEPYFVPNPKPEKPVKAGAGKTAKVPAAELKQRAFNDRINTLIETKKGGVTAGGYTLSIVNGKWGLRDKLGIEKYGTENITSPRELATYIGSTLPVLK